MSAKETMNRRAPVEALDFDEMKLWRGETGPNVADELASK